MDKIQLKKKPKHGDVIDLFSVATLEVSGFYLLGLGLECSKEFMHVFFSISRYYTYNGNCYLLECCIS